MAANPPAVFYELVLSASPAKPDPKFVGMSGVTVGVKVLTSVTLEAAEMKISDTDSSNEKVTKLQFPKKELGKLSLDYKEKLSVSFTVIDEILAEANTKKQYVFELDMAEAAQDFNGKSGKYSLTVIIGDAVISNHTAWVAAELDINLPEEDQAKQPVAFEPKPEILHVFRELSC